MDSNATHPNAYRIEADEKRQQAARLAAEANDLEAKAIELEGGKPSEEEARQVAAQHTAAAEDNQDKKNPFKR